MNNYTMVSKSTGKISIWGIAICTFLCVTALNAFTAQVPLAWNPNPEDDIAGYKIYYGMARRRYTVAVDVKKVTNYTVSGLVPWQTFYFAATAYDVAGNESRYSNEVKYYAIDIDGDWSANAEEMFAVAGLGKISVKSNGMVGFNRGDSPAGTIELLVNSIDPPYGRYTGPFSVMSNGQKITWALDEPSRQNLEAYLRDWFTEWAQAEGLLINLSNLEDFQVTRTTFKAITVSKKLQSPARATLRATGQARGILGGKLTTKKFKYSLSCSIIPRTP